MARDGSNDGLFDLGGQQRPGLDKGLGVGFGKGEGSHLLDVGAGSEGLFGAGQDNDFGFVRGIEFVESYVKLVDKGSAQGIEGLGAVQSNYSSD